MKVLNIIILVVLTLTMPITAMGILYGLAGSTSHLFTVISIGYVLTIVTATLSLFWKVFRYYPLIGLLLIAIGLSLDHQYWKQHNIDLCVKLRANPSCIEDNIGFDCSDFEGHNVSIGKGICKDVPE